MQPIKPQPLNTRVFKIQCYFSLLKIATSNKSKQIVSNRNSFTFFDLMLTNVVKNTGDHFKKVMFFFLALTIKNTTGGYKMTMKSLTNSLWNMIAAYNFKL